MVFALLYAVAAAVLLCSSFALMSQGFRGGSAAGPPIRSRHPEAPEPGERLLYVDLNRERLEALYQQAS